MAITDRRPFARDRILGYQTMDIVFANDKDLQDKFRIEHAADGTHYTRKVAAVSMNVYYDTGTPKWFVRESVGPVSATLVTIGTGQVRFDFTSNFPTAFYDVYFGEELDTDNKPIHCAYSSRLVGSVIVSTFKNAAGVDTLTNPANGKGFSIALHRNYP